ncbi:MAG: copper chaperone CopZ [Moraxellaceae bacterium]|jgi:copper chaperone|nr:copper chaperone CopZ [Moraxellaceae bacterium]
MHILNVTGMGCGSCVVKVENAVRRLDAAAKVRVDRAQGRVEVDSAASAEALCEALAAIGYPAVPGR